jgi:hypothetical protein
MSTDAWGISETWLDDDEVEQHPSDATLAALREVIGVPPDDLEDRAPLVIVTSGDVELPDGELVCEDGVVLQVGGPSSRPAVATSRRVCGSGAWRCSCTRRARGTAGA